MFWRYAGEIPIPDYDQSRRVLLRDLLTGDSGLYQCRLQEGGLDGPIISSANVTVIISGKTWDNGGGARLYYHLYYHPFSCSVE